MRKIGSFFNEESNHYKMVWFLIEADSFMFT